MIQNIGSNNVVKSNQSIIPDYLENFLQYNKKEDMF
jgi:hypothetical protein